MVYIYALIDPRTKLVRYVGQTSNLKERYYQHCSSTTLRKTYVGCWLKSLWRLEIKPILEVLSVETEETWKQGEKFWIAYFRRLGCSLTNLTDGGDGTRGIVRSSEFREKIRQANLGKRHTAKTKKKMSENRMGHPVSQKVIDRAHNLNLGKVFSLKTREKMRLAHIGKALSSETRKHLSEAIRESWKIRKTKQLQLVVR